MKSIIIEVNDLLIKADAEKLEQPLFTVETPDYLIEFMNFGGTSLKVNNAMNGYGHNCREDFAGKEVTIYYSECNHEWVAVPDYTAFGKPHYMVNNTDVVPAKITCYVCGASPNPTINNHA